jgi:hypothetical protein
MYREYIKMILEDRYSPYRLSDVTRDFEWLFWDYFDDARKIGLSFEEAGLYAEKETFNDLSELKTYTGSNRDSQEIVNKLYVMTQAAGRDAKKGLADHYSRQFQGRTFEI